MVFIWSKRKKFDLIYCRFLKEQAFIASLAKIIFILPQPLISCPACSGIIGDIQQLRRSSLNFFLLWIFNRGISCINAISKDILDEIPLLRLNKPRISSFPNGVKMGDSFERPSNDDRPLRIVFVGRLVRQKGIDILLKALAVKKENMPPFDVRIIGDGPLKTLYEKICITLKLDKTVSFLGGLPYELIPQELNQANLFVLPSRNEGMPGALLEAIAQGLPVVTTRCGGAEDLVDETIGWVVPPENPEELANAIFSALSLGAEALKEMGIKAREKAAREYEISIIANKYLDLFYELSHVLPKD